MSTLILIALLCVPQLTQDRVPTQWLSGKSLDRAKQLAISIRWKDVPLRDRMVELSQNQKIPLFIDRRIDPNQTLNLRIDQKTWDQTIWTVANELKLEICQLDEIYYVTPTTSSLPIRLAYDRNKEQLRRNRKTLKAPWLVRSEFNIPRFQQPRELLKQLAEQHELSFEGIDQIPLDVWPGYELPKINLLQKVTLLLSGFGSYPEISDDGKTIRIVKLPNIDSAKIRILCNSQPKLAAKTLVPLFKDLSIRPYSQGLFVEGPAEDIVRLQAKLVELQTVVVGDQNKKELSVTASRGQILATMAQQLGVKMVFETKVRPKLEEQVSLQMSDANEEDVIQQALQGTGLTYQLDDEQLKIYPK